MCRAMKVLCMLACFLADSATDGQVMHVSSLLLSHVVNLKSLRLQATLHDQQGLFLLLDEGGYYKILPVGHVILLCFYVQL